MLRAAVIVPIVLGPEPEVLFIRRAAHLRRNPGQIGFPGGLLDAGEDARTAALRECREEIGVEPGLITIVDSLPEVWTQALSVTIVPLVGTLVPPFELRIDRGEVERTYAVPLRAVIAPGAVHEDFEPYAGLRVKTWIFDHEDMHVWGATGRILRDFVEKYGRTGETLKRFGLWADRRR